jgi:hypothetical protein
MTTTPRRGRGRPTKLTPELQDNLVKALRAFNHLDTAAHFVGVAPNTVRRWLAEAEADNATPAQRDFRDAISRARAEAEVRIVAGVAKAALGGALVRRVTRTLRDGTVETEEQFAAPDGRVGLEFLARAFPDRWARRQADRGDGCGRGADSGGAADRDRGFGGAVAGDVAGRGGVAGD